MRRGILFLVCVLFFASSSTARAQQVTERKDYPLTNRGVCEMMHYQEWEVRGASMQEVVTLCKHEGITL